MRRAFVALASVLAVRATLVAAASDCKPASGEYQGYLVKRVGIKTPLEFPVAWINRLLLGPAIASLQPLAEDLPVKKDTRFEFSKHLEAMERIRDAYGVLRPGERLKVALVVPKLSACDDTAKTMEIDYRVYTTDALYYVSRLLETRQDVPGRNLTIGPASETAGKANTVPIAGYDKAKHLFGGMRSSWNGKGSFVNRAVIEAYGSSSSHVATVSVGGERDPDSGAFSHLEWEAAFRSENEPAAGNRELRQSTGLGQFLAATRASGAWNFISRFGGSLEGGYRRTDHAPAGILGDAPYRALKLVAGEVWNAGRTIGEASYGLQIAKGTDRTPVDFQKHLIDISEQIRILPVEHRTLRLDLRFNAGWINGASDKIPVAERFFGGNFTSNFIDSTTWRINAAPLLRSFPHNQLSAPGPQPDIGGSSFQAVNATIAYTAWGYPAIPAVIRHAKPLEDGIHLGLNAAQSTALEDFRARTREFQPVVKRMAVAKTDLSALRERANALSSAGLPTAVTDKISSIIGVVDVTLESIEDALSRPSSGVAWKAAVNLGLSPTADSQLGMIRDAIRDTAPDLVTVGRPSDATDLLSRAQTLDGHQIEIAKMLAPIEPLAVLDPHRFDPLKAAADEVAKHGTELRDVTKRILTPKLPAAIAALANDAQERSAALTEPVIDDTDPFGSLYNLTRLSIGIGKLVPPQLASAISVGEALELALRNDGRTSDADAVQAPVNALRADLKTLQPMVAKLPLTPGERWSRQQNAYFKRALDVAFRELNLGAVSPAILFDAARIGPTSPGLSALHFGIGPAVRFSIVTFDVTVGYSFNPRRRGSEPIGQFFFSMDISDLFR